MSMFMFVMFMSVACVFMVMMAGVIFVHGAFFTVLRFFTYKSERVVISART